MTEKNPLKKSADGPKQPSEAGPGVELPDHIKPNKHVADTVAHVSDSAAMEPGFPVVGIGASAGGLEAFTQLLRALPVDTGMGFVLVQHLDPDHENALVQILGRATALPVVEIGHNQPVRPNHVYVIPRDTSLSIEGGVLKLAPRTKGRTPHRPIDSFFESLSQDRHERAIGVVLSGTASDGTLGLEAIKAEGGITFAQDGTATHDSMPRSAIASGSVDLVLAPADIAKELARIAKHPFVASVPFEHRAEGEVADDRRGEDDRAQATAHADDDTALPSGGPPTAYSDHPARTGKSPLRGGGAGKVGSGDTKGEVAAEGTADDGYKRILLLLRNHSGVDFSLYKSTTIRRRITRRVVINQQPTLAGYAAFLKGNSKELDALYSDVLISVTSFFRNPEAFEAIQREVLPALIRQRRDDPVRCWVLGCSTGQEAYSLAMAFVEVAEKATHARTLQVFATDLNDALLDKARHGLYARSLAEDISPERLRRFFTEEDGGYRITKSLREMVVFARQNLIADPPFSRMDLISCRNLLIYLEPTLQKKAIPTFHYALRPGGFLMLGVSESVSGFTELFEPVDKKHKIYSKRAAVTPAFHVPLGRGHGDYEGGGGARPHLPPRRPGSTEPPDGVRGELNAQREADRIAVNQFAPPGVLINAENQVLQFRGPTGAYLEPPAGKASFDVLKMAREGLMLPLRAAIQEATNENKPARREGVRVQRGPEGGEARTINVEVIPLKNLPERCFLVVFEEPDRQAPGGRALPRQQPAASTLSKAEEASRIAELEADLSETREYLQAMQEQHEAATEELQASNEEVQSANEELQSVNEELETSKEELESSNEELTTVNEEMSNRNTELSRLNSDLANFQTSTKLAVVLLGRDLTIRRFSPQAQKQFDLLATDIGRPIGRVRHGLVSHSSAGPVRSDAAALTDLERMAAETIASVREQECDVQERTGGWYSLRVRPYITLDNKVDGAVLVLVDITERKLAEQAAAHLAAIITSSDDAIISKGLDGVIISWNKAAERLFGYTAQEAIGNPVTILIPPDRVGEETGIIRRIARGEVVENYETVRCRKDGSCFDTLLTISPIRDAAGRIVGASKLARDITQRKRTDQVLRESQAQLHESEGRYRTLLTSIDEGFCIIEMIFDEHDNPVDYRFLEVNPTFEKQCGLIDAVGKTMREMRPKHEEHWFQIYGKVALTGEAIRFTNEAKQLAGQWYDVYACRVGGPGSRKVAVVFNDITERKKSADALRESHDRFETLFNTSPVGMYLVDADFRLRNMSAQTRATVGDTEDLTGRDFSEIVRIVWPPQTADEIVSRFRHCLETGESYRSSDFSAERSDRKVRESFDWQIHRITLPDGRYGVVCYFMDISDRVRAEQSLHDSETRYRRLFQTAKDGILILDAHSGKITDANAFMGGLVGLEAQAMVGMELHEIGMFGDAEASKQAFRTLQKNKYLRYEHLPVQNRSGGTVEVEVVANVYREGDKMVAQCNVRDISQRVVMEQKIKEQTEQLAGESRRKDEFLAMLSHELRNPLAPIRSAVHLLRTQERAGGENLIQKQAHEIIERQVANLTKIVSDLLEVARVVSGKIRLAQQVVDLHEVARHAIETAMPLIEQRRHQLVLHPCLSEGKGAGQGVWVNADPTRLEEVFINLLNNAAKYTPENRGGKIEIWCEHPRGTNHAQFRIRDNGVGIDKSLLPRIFDLFTQADRSLARSAGGLGIGLSLVHRLVELHGGTVEAHSPPEGQASGSEFIVRLPMVYPPLRPEVVGAKTLAAVPDATEGTRVLIVDDNIDLVMVLASSLRSKGYNVQAAYTGPDGIKTTQHWRPDVVLLDIGLPGLDGYEVARRLRAENLVGNAGKAMRLIAVTGYGRKSDLALAREAGFDDHLIKPVEFDKLENMIANQGGAPSA